MIAHLNITTCIHRSVWKTRPRLIYLICIFALIYSGVMTYALRSKINRHNSKGSTLCTILGAYTNTLLRCVAKKQAQSSCIAVGFCASYDKPTSVEQSLWIQRRIRARESRDVSPIVRFAIPYIKELIEADVESSPFRLLRLVFARVFECWYGYRNWNLAKKSQKIEGPTHLLTLDDCRDKEPLRYHITLLSSPILSCSHKP